MRIRPASHDDVDFIESAYTHARAFMRRNGNADQWPAHYPSRIDAQEDTARGHCFLVEDDEGPLAVFAFGPGPESDYTSIDGAWRAETPYHVIHRLASVRGAGASRGRPTTGWPRRAYGTRHPPLGRGRAHKPLTLRALI